MLNEKGLKKLSYIIIVVAIIFFISIIGGVIYLTKNYSIAKEGNEKSLIADTLKEREGKESRENEILSNIETIDPGDMIEYAPSSINNKKSADSNDEGTITQDKKDNVDISDWNIHGTIIKLKYIDDRYMEAKIEKEGVWRNKTGWVKVRDEVYKNNEELDEKINDKTIKLYSNNGDITRIQDLRDNKLSDIREMKEVNYISYKKDTDEVIISLSTGYKQYKRLNISNELDNLIKDLNKDRESITKEINTLKSKKDNNINIYLSIIEVLE